MPAKHRWIKRVTVTAVWLYERAVSAAPSSTGSQSSKLWPLTCVRRWPKENIRPFDFIFSGWVLIKTGVGGDSTHARLSSSEGETGSECLRAANTESLKNKHVYRGGNKKKKQKTKHVEFIYCSFLDPINQLMLCRFIRLFQLRRASFWHFSPPPFTIPMTNENVLPSGATQISVLPPSASGREVERDKGGENGNGGICEPTGTMSHIISHQVPLLGASRRDEAASASLAAGLITELLPR